MAVGKVQRLRVRTLQDAQRQLDLLCGKVDELIDALAALAAPQMTTVQRDAIAYPDDGMLIYNTTTARTEAYENGAWVDL